jgi:hypothetical protein
LTAVDPFTIFVVVSFAGVLVAILLLGLYHPKSGAEILDWKPTRSPELEVQNEIDDMEQMIAAQNALRARHGKAPRSEEEIEAQVARHKAEMDEYSQRYWADQAELGRKPTKEDL